MARKSPLEWGSRLLIALLKIHEALLKVGERGKIVRSEYLSLNDGEIDFNLVDPAGVNGSVHKKSVGPSGSNAFHGFLTTVSRTVIHDPKNTLRGFVGLGRITSAMSRSVGAMPFFFSQCPKSLARWTSQAAR